MLPEGNNGDDERAADPIAVLRRITSRQIATFKSGGSVAHVSVTRALLLSADPGTETAITSQACGATTSSNLRVYLLTDHPRGEAPEQTVVQKRGCVCRRRHTRSPG